MCVRGRPYISIPGIHPFLFGPQTLTLTTALSLSIHTFPGYRLALDVVSESVLAFQSVVIGVSLVTATEVGNLQNKTFVESVQTRQDTSKIPGDDCIHAVYTVYCLLNSKCLLLSTMPTLTVYKAMCINSKCTVLLFLSLDASRSIRFQ